MNAYTYPGLRRQFIENGHKSEFDKAVRAEIVRRFEMIDQEVKAASTPTDGLFIAEALLGTRPDGAVVECGCFLGASSAKLSILARLTGRRLVVFDSFEGLPEVDASESTDLHLRHDGTPEWWSGRYEGALELVQATVERFGEASACDFVKGWFEETLPGEHLPERVAFAFTDVDLPSSARQCLCALWPNIPEQGVYFSHDVAFIKVLQVFQDSELWRSLSEPVPPILFGAGFGLCDRSPHLGYFVKGRSLSPEYVKKLTIYR